MFISWEQSSSEFCRMQLKTFYIRNFCFQLFVDLSIFHEFFLFVMNLKIPFHLQGCLNQLLWYSFIFNLSSVESKFSKLPVNIFLWSQSIPTWLSIKLHLPCRTTCIKLVRYEAFPTVRRRLETTTLVRIFLRI